jgi:hypothetical protein
VLPATANRYGFRFLAWRHLLLFGSTVTLSRQETADVDTYHAHAVCIRVRGIRTSLLWVMGRCATEKYDKSRVVTAEDYSQLFSAPKCLLWGQNW